MGFSLSENEAEKSFFWYNTIVKYWFCMQLNKSEEVMRRGTLENKKAPKILADDFYSTFASLHSKMRLNSALYYGRDSVKALFQSNSKTISAPAMHVLQELKSFVMNNARMPYLFSYNKQIEQYFIDIFNELLTNAYSQSNINGALIDAWHDFMVAGIGILKVESDSDKIFKAENIPATSCIFDHTSKEKPQFFICESILSTELLSSLYGIDQKEWKGVLGKPSQPKIIQSQESWDRAFTKQFSPAEGKTYNKKDLNSIYSSDFVKTVVYEKPQIGLNTVREEWRKTYAYENKQVYEMYERNIYVNDVLVKTSNIPIEQFPFILLYNRKKDSLLLEEAFPCFLDQIKSDILLYNNLFCLQLDGLTSAAAASSMVAIDQEAMLDGQNRTNKSENTLNLIKLNPTTDKKIQDIIYKTSPIDLSQSIQNEMQLCLGRIHKASGLMNFDSNSVSSSGFHEQLRQDRESSTLSFWLTTLDDSIMRVGSLAKGVISQFLKVETSILRVLLSDPDSLDAETAKALLNVSEYALHGVQENKESFTFKNKIINDLVTLRNLTGESFLIDTKLLASSLNMPQAVVDIVDQNRPDATMQKIEVEAQLTEIQKTKAAALKDSAQAAKYVEEAKEISKKKTDQEGLT